MNPGPLSSLQRVLVIVAAAILLPAVLVIGLVSREVSLNQLLEVEREAQEAADLIVLLADSRAQADITALRVLSQSRYFASGDIAGGAARAQDTIELVPGWMAVTLTNSVTGEVAFRTTLTDTTYGRSGVQSTFSKQSETGFGGIERDGPQCPCVYFQVPVANLPELVLTAIVDPQYYQEKLMERRPEGAVAALVDRTGDFVARSVNYAERVGTPATRFVRDAVAQGGRGIYLGTTYEGLTNHTAYTISTLTGWSAHVAINDALIYGPRSRANTALISGSLAAILIGAALFYYVLQDVAARRLEERRIVERQKAEAVQLFTVTVVHDFRNIVSAVQSGLYMIVRQSKEPATLKYAEMIGEVMERGLRLTNRLLSFVREDTAEVEDVDIGKFLLEMQYLLEQAAGQGVKVQIETPEDPATVRANRDQLELALINLVVNARDAMGGEGLVDIHAAASEDEVRISVADTGPGIPFEMRTKVLKPFFTTKPEGEGTGLGLAQVAETIRAAGGRVTIGEANGSGALITLFLKR